jgi:hypothetical protein
MWNEALILIQYLSKVQRHIDLLQNGEYIYIMNLTRKRITYKFSWTWGTQFSNKLTHIVSKSWWGHILARGFELCTVGVSFGHCSYFSKGPWKVCGCQWLCCLIGYYIYSRFIWMVCLVYLRLVNTIVAPFCPFCRILLISYLYSWRHK